MNEDGLGCQSVVENDPLISEWTKMAKNGRTYIFSPHEGHEDASGSRMFGVGREGRKLGNTWLEVN